MWDSDGGHARYFGDDSRPIGGGPTMNERLAQGGSRYIDPPERERSSLVIVWCPSCQKNWGRTLDHDEHQCACPACVERFRLLSMTYAERCAEATK